MPAAIIPLFSYPAPQLDLSPLVIVGAATPASQDVPTDQAIIRVVGELALFPSYP